MKEDYIAQLHLEGLPSRLKRLSDSLLYSTRDLYKTMDVSIEPNWNLVFRILKDYETLTITEIAEKLQFSHPAVIKITSKMKKNGYIISAADTKDRRKQILKLSDKARAEMGYLESLWLTQVEVIKELFAESPTFMQELSKIENKIATLDYKQRVLNSMEQ